MNNGRGSVVPSSAHLAARNGYSLIELLVVLAVIVMISLASLPNIFGRNDRLSLDTSANRIRQLLIDAKTRSQAPSGKEAGSLGQVYQVSIGEFQTGQTNYTVVGTAKTSSLVLERGSSRCDPTDTQGGFTRLKELKLPRNIYVSSFFPVSRTGTDTKAAVRFTVGQVGFLCGLSTNPSIESTNFNELSWIGKSGETSQEARARYLVITVSAQKISEKRYVVIDRQTSEVSVSKTDPQTYFTPLADALKPKWTNVDQANFSLSLRCGNATPSELTFTFPRAEDRVTDPNVTDPNLAVFYDISWNINGEQVNSQPLYRPLAIRYFYDVRTGFETVRYNFETTSVSVANQNFNVTVNVAASDQGANLQDPFLTAPNVERQRQKTFLLDCGNGTTENEEAINPDAEQTDPAVINQTCTQSQANLPLRRAGRVADRRLWLFEPMAPLAIIRDEGVECAVI